MIKKILGGILLDYIGVRPHEQTNAKNIEIN